MERYNLRSGSLETVVVSSSSAIQDSGRTEESRLAEFCCKRCSTVRRWGYRPKIDRTRGNSVPLQSPWDGDLSDSRNIREPVESSGVRDEVLVPWVRDLLIPTLTDTLPVLSPGTVSTVFGWELGYRKRIW